MEMFDDTKALFAQLADIPGTQGVKTLIENHDAWHHNDRILTAADATLRSRLINLQTDPVCLARIQQQRLRLQTLATQIGQRYASAG